MATGSFGLRQLPGRARALFRQDRDRVIEFNSSIDNPNQPVKRFNLVPGVGIISYLPLQMSLYFNVYFSPFWMLTLIIALEVKFNSLLTHYKYVTIAIYIVMATVETVRLYLGYEGNLREKVAELAGFWLLSLFQLPLVIYLMANVNTIIIPLEWAINIPMTLFLIVQIITGFRALQLMTRAQAVKYHLSQLQTQLHQSLSMERIKEEDFIRN